MSQALYRKWRPATFDQVVGQEHITRTLRNAVAAGRIGHAYLLSGPRGTGKTTTARLLAKAANCRHEEPVRRPCNQCGPCLAINDGRFLDLIEIDAASNTGVDDIRDLREKINFSPSEGRFKVYIIDEVHMLSMSAFNALLKTLEEPPPHAKFVLATTEEHKVPLTIKSRCQPFSFRLLTHPEIVGRLEWLAAQESLEIDPEALDMIAHHASGSLRDAESLLDQLVTVPGETISLARTRQVLGTAPAEAVGAVTEAWLQGDGAAGLAAIHAALDHGADARQFARQMVGYLRQLLLLQTAGEGVNLNVGGDNRENMIRQAQAVGRRELIEAVKRFNEAVAVSAGSWQPQLPLELAFIQLLPPERPPMAPSRPSAEGSRAAVEGQGERAAGAVAGPEAEPGPEPGHDSPESEPGATAQAGPAGEPEGQEQAAADEAPEGQAEDEVPPEDPRRRRKPALSRRPHRQQRGPHRQRLGPDRQRRAASRWPRSRPAGRGCATACSNATATCRR
jgi:DNA polymerase III subunit gamma/tau